MYTVKLIAAPDSSFDPSDSDGMHEWMTDRAVAVAQTCASAFDLMDGAPVISRQIRNIKDMVFQIRCATGKGQMERLIVMSHGISQGDTILIGSESLSSGNISQYNRLLSEVAPYFSKNGYAHFESCDVGSNCGKSVLVALAKMFGVPVYGGVGLENPIMHYNGGGYVVGYPNGKLMPTERPQWGM
jgi:hypothetical protein